MDINYIVILGGAVLSMIVGSVWYGPLFGKKWMEVCGVSGIDEEKRKRMQKEAMPLYLVQFLLSILQLSILLNLITWGMWQEQSMSVAFFLWLGFIVPTLAGSSMWNNDSTKIKWMRFLIQSGYQFVMFILYGYLISVWG
jgi:Protein of unknown function (DUF1761)